MAAPHESTHFAFFELVQLAQADHRVRTPERRVLERFARHLGISQRKACGYYRVSRRRTAVFPEDPQRQLDLLKMLARVAYSDGVMQDEERKFFDQLAADFNIPRTRLAHVLEEAEAKAQRHTHLNRRWWCAALVGVAILGAIGWILAFQKPDEMTGFKVLDRELRPSLLLVHTRYALRHKSEPTRRFSATGTGFFVSESGLVITNKHVIQPWRFVGKGLNLIAAGYALDEKSVEVLAWREGQRALGSNGRPLVASAYHSKQGSLEVLATAPDAAMPLAKRPRLLRRKELFCHANDDGDLALLRCRVARAVPATTLATGSSDVRRLDPVLVLGYPRGIHLLESATAMSSPTVGRVRKVENTIYITAPVVGGNSGGPLLDRDGQVIGVATRTFGSSTLAGCVRVEHVHRLMERVQ